MKCPHLKDARAKFCGASVFKKMILQTADQVSSEKCSTLDYRDCPIVRKAGPVPEQSLCPYLQESLVQYCSASAVTRLIPCGDTTLSRCGNESHRYCDLYLALLHPQELACRPVRLAEPSAARRFGEIEMPSRFAYSANHMWLDVSEDGCCNIGIDAFLARVAGSIERLSFVSTKGLANPTAVLTVRGVDLQMIFPNRMLITRTNAYLRANPEKIITDPYTRGWLFEGMDALSPSQATVREGLLTGDHALGWMRNELRRLGRYLERKAGTPALQASRRICESEGSSGLTMRHLDREGILFLFNEFFAPHAGWKMSSGSSEGGSI